MKFFWRKSKELPAPDQCEPDLYPTMTNSDPGRLGFSVQSTASFHVSDKSTADEDWTLFLTLPKTVIDYLNQKCQARNAPVALYFDGRSGGSAVNTPQASWYATFSTQTMRLNGGPHENSLNPEEGKKSEYVICLADSQEIENQ